jgi:hypothetical protein
VLTRSVIRRNLEHLGALADFALAELPPTDTATDEKPR